MTGLKYSGRKSAKLGSAPVTYFATYALGLSILLISPVINYPLQCMAFVIFGFALATQDVAMNAHAIVLEQEANKRYMSTFHAMFSAGTLFGALVGGFLHNKKFH